MNELSQTQCDELNATLLKLTISSMIKWTKNDGRFSTSIGPYAIRIEQVNNIDGTYQLLIYYNESLIYYGYRNCGNYDLTYIQQKNLEKVQEVWNLLYYSKYEHLNINFLDTSTKIHDFRDVMGLLKEVEKLILTKT